MGTAWLENAVQRIKGLAGSLMHGLQMKLGGVVFSSNHALWTWSMRHAAWLLNRFNPHRGLAVFEMVFWKALQWAGVRVRKACAWIFKDLDKGESKVETHVVHWKSGRPRQFSLVRWRLINFDQVSSKGQVQLGGLHGVLQGIQP